MTKNQLTLALVVVGILLVIALQDSVEKTETINARNATIDAQRRQVANAEYARAEADARASTVAAERDRFRTTIGELEAKLQAITPPADPA
jgi:hypothetical protein